MCLISTATPLLDATISPSDLLIGIYKPDESIYHFYLYSLKASTNCLNDVGLYFSKLS
jgi:hypothetical protein